MKWINVKESLPPQSKGYNTSKWVLVTVKTSKDTKFICMGRYSYESNHWDISNYEYGVTPIYSKDKDKITAWADVDPFEECKDCYPELGYKNDRAKRDTEAVEKFVESEAFTKLMESLDEQDRAAKEDAEQFLRGIKGILKQRSRNNEL